MNAAVGVAMGSGLIDALPTDGSAITAEKMASTTGAEKRLVVRIMRVLCALGFCNELSQQTYSHGRMSQLLTAVPPLKAFLKHCSEDEYPAQAHLNEHLQKSGYKEPSNPSNGAYQSLYGITGSFYEHMADDKRRVENFALAMAVAKAATFNVSKYPFPQRIRESSADEYTLVDVAGGKGQLLQEITSAYPEWKGKKMLQDRPEVIKDLQGKEATLGYSVMVHDYCQPENVRAGAFIFRWIFMDNTDERCQQILRSLKPVFEKNSTKLLLIENTIPETGAGITECGLDMIMMALSSSKQRTEKEFEELLATEGFKVTGIFRDGEQGERALIEAVLS